MQARPSAARRRPGAALAAVMAGLALVSCGNGDPKPGPEVAGGNAGVDERVGADIKVLDVELEYPLDGGYEGGEEADLYLAISNTGSAPDDLVAITGPDFTDVRVTGGSDGLPIPVPGNDNVYIGAEGAPAVTLVDLQRDLRSSESIPVTFRFRTAGRVTVQAVVAAEGQDPRAPHDFPGPDEDPTDDG